MRANVAIPPKIQVTTQSAYTHFFVCINLIASQLNLQNQRREWMKALLFGVKSLTNNIVSSCKLEGIAEG